MISPRRLALLLASVLLLASTTACGGSDDSSGDASGIAAADTWVKATEGAEMTDMSAAFGVLSNSGSDDVKIVGVTTDLTDRAELHETVDGAMRETDSFTIPAGGSLSLEPGGNHLMLLDLTDPIKPGDEIDFTLEFEDGSTFDLSAVAKDFAGADEDYDDMGGDADGGMDMGH